MITKTKTGYTVNGQFVTNSNALEVWRAIDRFYHREDVALRLNYLRYNTSTMDDSVIDKITDEYECNLDCDCSWMQCADRAIEEAMQEDKQMGDWISVDERLPEKKDYSYIWVGSRHFIAVLVYSDREISLGMYQSVSNKWVDNNGDVIDFVTHWTPLPKTPESIEKDTPGYMSEQERWRKGLD